MKLEGNEIYENIQLPSNEEIEKGKENRIAVMSQIMAMVPQIKKISYISEDDKYDTNMADLQIAIFNAKVKELENFCKTKKIYFDGGFLKVTLKK